MCIRTHQLPSDAATAVGIIAILIFSTKCCQERRKVKSNMTWSFNMNNPRFSSSTLLVLTKCYCFNILNIIPALITPVLILLYSELCYHGFIVVLVLTSSAVYAHLLSDWYFICLYRTIFFMVVLSHIFLRKHPNACTALSSRIVQLHKSIDYYYYYIMPFIHNYLNF